jgi:phosphonopyruvate decarboxylase
VIHGASFLDEARRAGFGLASGVPDSDLGALVAAWRSSRDVRYVGATNEGDAVAIASGAALGGSRALVPMQNSGLGNAVNPLTSLSAVFRLPALLVIAWRGEPAARPDEPQHAPMGRITPALLDLLGVPWERLPGADADLAAAFARAAAHMERARTPYAFVVGAGTVEAAATTPATVPPSSLPPTAVRDERPWPEARPSRRDVIAAVRRALGPRDVLLATTGYTGREMTALVDAPNQLAMVGSMGCVGSLGLGLACVRPERRVVVLDGDGAALMRLGALATIGHERPPNLVHVLLDNEVHESTGGQATVASTADLGGVAHACGYPRVVRATSAAQVHDLVAANAPGLAFIHVKTSASGEPPPPRPTTGPAEAAARLTTWLGA